MMPSHHPDNNEHPVVWTIGHSNHSAEKFLAMLKSFDIEHLIDIRRFPGSKKYSHFNKDMLEPVLAENNLRYTHLPELGGRRKPRVDSINTAWQHEAFRGYADYMENKEFKSGMNTLENFALKSRVAFMCSEAVWWSCHRSLVSDYLKNKGWLVMHIMRINNAQEHPYTSAAKIHNGQLAYTSDDLFS